MSYHYSLERNKRERLIKKIGLGQPFDEFIIDRKHEDGPERHVLTTTGIIIVYNLYTNKMVTKLIARPNQIKRYYAGKPVPLIVSVVEALALYHQYKKYNAI